MNKLTDEELKYVKGGFGWFAASMAALFIFIVGVFSGMTNPEKCK